MYLQNAFHNEDNCVILFFLTDSLVFNLPSNYHRAQTVIPEHKAVYKTFNFAGPVAYHQVLLFGC